MFQRIVVTGAAGGIGQLIRGRIDHLAEHLRLSDIEDVGAPRGNEEIVPCDLSDRAAVDALLEGCDGVIHLGGISVERPWSEILPGNIVGVHNLYEAARRAGTRRIFFASSNHAIGYYRQDELLDADAPIRPDGLYGVSKCFGEAMASLYWDKFGIETARVRIGSCFEKPKDHRMLATWLSPDDFVRLLTAIFTVPRLGCPVIYGVSANQAVWWDNRKAAYVGWRPEDSSEPFRAELDAAMDAPPKDAAVAVYQGGSFTEEPIHEDR